jgi:hypothetical protein
MSLLVAPVADEELPALIARAAAEFPDLPIDAEAVLQVHRWSHSVLAVKADAGIVGGLGALFLNVDGYAAMIDGTLSMHRPPVRLLARTGAPVAAVYVWMFVARKNGNAAWAAFRRFVAARAPGASIYGRPINAVVMQFYSKCGAAPIFAGSSIWVLPANLGYSEP